VCICIDIFKQQNKQTKKLLAFTWGTILQELPPSACARSRAPDGKLSLAIASVGVDQVRLLILQAHLFW